MAKKESFDDIDDLLGEIEQSSQVPLTITSEVDDLCNDIDTGVDNRKKEIEGWAEDVKHREAVDSKDPFAINVLSMDKSFPVRTLAACNPLIPKGAMQRLVDEGDYMRMVVANNPSCSTDILERIAGLTDDRRVLDVVMMHKNASPALKFRINPFPPTAVKPADINSVSQPEPIEVVEEDKEIKEEIGEEVDPIPTKSELEELLGPEKSDD